MGLGRRLTLFTESFVSWLGKARQGEREEERRGESTEWDEMAPILLCNNGVSWSC